MLNTNDIIRNCKQAQELRYGNHRIIYEYNKMSKDNWEDFENEMDILIQDSLRNGALFLAGINDQRQLDLAWLEIKTNFQKAAKKIIPHKSIRNPQTTSNRKRNRLILQFYIINLKNIKAVFRFCKNNLGSNLQTDYLEKFQPRIDHINRQHPKLNFPLVWNTD